MTDNELHRELSDALRAVEPGFMGIDDVDQSTNTVYYSCAPEDRWMVFQRTFVSGADAVTLNEDRIEVEPVIRYEPVMEAASTTTPPAATPVAAKTSVAPATVETPAPAEATSTPTAAESHAGPCKCQSQSALSAQGEAMHKNAERIKALIANTATPWTEADQAFLEALTDDRLAGFETTAVTAAAAAPETPVAPAAPVVAPTVAAAAPAVAEMSVDDFMKTAPAEVKAIVLAARKADADKRAGHIAALKAAQSEFTEAEMGAMSTEQLERFDRALSREDEDGVPAVDFSARRAAAASASTTKEPPNGYAVALAKQKGAK